jgi:hypothetical protein
MPELTVNYVYYAGRGPHTRQPRNTGSYGGFTPIDSLSGSLGTLGEGSTFNTTLGLMPNQVTDATVNPPVTYTFAFVNVSGGTNGGQTSFDPNTPPGGATVGSAPIIVQVVYLPPTGVGGGSSTGASIDAFDETTGSLVDDTFVTVSPDPNGSLTTSGNVDGWVATTNTETIAAYSHLVVSNVDFEKWVSVTGPPTPPAGLNFTAAQNTNYIVLALYKATPGPSQGELTCDGLVQGILKMTTSGLPGPRFTTAEWTKIMADLERCVWQGYLSQTTVNSVITQYEAYAEGKTLPPGGGLPKL